MTNSSIDSIIPRRYYWATDVEDPIRCPQCQSELIVKYLSYLLIVQRSYGENDEFFVGNEGGAICPNCPTIVLKPEVFEDLAGVGINDEPFIDFTVIGLIDTKLMSNDHADPVPVIPFTNSAISYRSTPIMTEKISKKSRKKRRRKSKIGRNDPCPCGSGVKYKKCCLGKKKLLAHRPSFENLVYDWSKEGLEKELEKDLPKYFRTEIFDNLLEMYEINPRENADILKILVNEIYLKKSCSIMAEETLERTFALQDTLSDEELESLREKFPRIFTVLKKNPDNVHHPFTTILSCICMNNIHKIRDVIEDIIDVFIKAKPENRIYYSHLLISIAHDNPAALIPVLDEIINMGIDKDNVLVILAIIAEKFPERVIDLVPSIMSEYETKSYYYTYQFLAAVSLKRPDIIKPYLEKLKREQKVVTDPFEKANLDECISRVSRIS